MSAPETTAKAVADSFFSATLSESDPEIAAAIGLELGRQRDEIELIASENIVSRAVLEAQGSVLTNKYAEGLPGKRYYGGCPFVDIPEPLGAGGVPRRGFNRAPGAHPSQGMAINMSGKWFKPVPYNVRRDDQRIDMDEVAKLAKEHKPKLIIAGGSAYPRIFDFKHFP